MQMKLVLITLVYIGSSNVSVGIFVMFFIMFLNIMKMSVLLQILLFVNDNLVHDI